MAHVLIVGMVRSGKTNLAKHLARRYAERGFQPLLFDPVGDPAWPIAEEYRYQDPDAFLRAAFSSLRCPLFIDESSEAVGRFDRERFILATRSRHRGHWAHFIAQRVVQCSPEIREQCSTVYAFRVGPKEAKSLAEEFGCEQLSHADRVPQYSCIRYQRFGEASQIEIPAFEA